MKLHEITDVSQFSDYYRQEGLDNVDDKIKHLEEATGLYSRHYNGATQEETLTGLEESVIYGTYSTKLTPEMLNVPDEFASEYIESVDETT